MKPQFFIVILFFELPCFSQNFFFEDFDYKDFSTVDSLYEAQPKKTIWSTNFSKNYEDISEDNIEDDDEHFKKSEIVADPTNPNNKVLRMELNKVSSRFYARHFCDDTLSNNLLDEKTLEARYDKERDLYCVGCKMSPQGVFNHYWRNKMNRNEISTFGKRKLYKLNKDYWVGFNLMIGDEYQFESEKNPELVFQFIAESDKAGYPPVELRIENDQFVLTIIKDNQGNKENYPLGKVEKGLWNQWKFHVNISRKDKKGHIELWKDNEKVFSQEGKNFWMRSKYYFKLGIYKWAWWNCSFPKSTTHKKVVYFDKIWASKENRNI